LLALPLGAIAATRPRTPTDRGILAVSVIGLAVHPFVLALFLRDFISTHFHVNPFSYCPLFGHSRLYPCSGPVSWASHLAVPWLVFALFFLPLYLRMIRVRLLETYSEPYISTARAKGASEPRILRVHALRNAVGPLLPMLAIDAGTAITAAIYIETVFNLPGLGQKSVTALSGAAGGYDLPLIVGIVAVVGTFVVLLNVAADAAGAWLDPRIRAKTSSGLIPLPRAVNARPRVRLALNVAVAAALVALFAVAVAHPGSTAGGAAALRPPVRTIALKWEDVRRVEGPIRDPKTGVMVLGRGHLEVKVTSVELGKSGWRVHASVANVSNVPLLVLTNSAPGMPAMYPHQPFSLIVQQDNGGGIRRLQPLAASTYSPAMPQELEGGAKWVGTFSGSDVVAKGTLFYVGFGQFASGSPYNQQQFSISSTDSATG
jgi:ABC-type dipeptide/oligopeptide/nickel transport system permease subunit